MQYKSALMTEATGHIDGLVASHNRWGHYFRPRVTPVNPNTTRQNVQRSILANLANLWQDLTPEQRGLWDEFGAAVPTTNRLGQEVFLTGQLSYIKANSNLALIVEALVSDPPAEFNNGQAVTPDPETWSFNIDTDTWSIDVARAAPESVDGHVLTFRGRAMNPSRKFYAGPYQLADIQAMAKEDAGQVCTAQIGVDDLSDYTIPETPARIPLRFVVQYEDGRLSHTERCFEIPDLQTTSV